MTAVLYALPALLLGAALVLAAEHAYRHRARLVATYRGLGALRGCKHARVIALPKPWHLLHTGGHRAPRGRHENALEVKAA